ncbi:putative DNA polymerase epsilon subunit c [Rosellinia necatrix]|uniref:NCT transcriptional regulatory complex subunit A n=1 Tax=Rosellinia necatrix TaxID=77044 RepID=A0A1W2TMU0_ROSNE|nr:putative DNA polymerase epsilon subunit c [Rosellinia necatrix]
MSATGDNTSYAPKSPDLSSLYAGAEAASNSRLNHYAFPNAGTSAPTSGNAYHPLQPPLGQTRVQTRVQTQVQTQVQALAQAPPPIQASLDPGSHTSIYNPHPQPHYQYPTQHYNNNNRTSNGSAATTTITNHSAYHHLPIQQHPPFPAYNDSNPQHQQLLSPYPHQPSAPYYSLQQQQQPQQQPQQQLQQQPQQPQQQQQPQYLLSHQPGYHSRAASSYYLSHTNSSTSTDRLPTSQSPPQQQQQLQQQLHPQPHPQPQSQPQPHTHQHQQSQPQPATSNAHSIMPRNKAAAAPPAKEPEIMESPVRTKFPTARIKRIMQADEEVGKVAQQTPIAVGKALELFMVQLVHKSAEVARDKNSKRITAPMLKQAIDSTNEWDFLRDIVAKVTEEREGAKGSGRAKADSDSDDDADAGEVKKRGRGGRKKKVVPA